MRREYFDVYGRVPDGSVTPESAALRAQFDLFRADLDAGFRSVNWGVAFGFGVGLVLALIISSL